MKRHWKSFKTSVLSRGARPASDVHANTLSVVDPATEIGSALSQDDEQPSHLPPEIEYEIFVLAFYNDEKGRTNLLRVAKRVTDWLIPMLYKVVIIVKGVDEQPYPPVESLRQHGHHVRSIVASFHFDSQGTFAGDMLLSSCPHVSDLVLWNGVNTTAKVLNLPITRLFFKETDFVGAKLWDLPKTPQIQRWCSNITHLVLGGHINDSEVASTPCLNVLTLFPSLTHFMTFCWNKTPVIRRILACCLRLKVFVWLWGRPAIVNRTTVAREGDECPVDDPRIVTLNGYYLTDWIKGSRGEDDIWILAEREIRNRRHDIHISLPVV
ncbi:hypothetical protein BDN72DRAFT_963237 [Pluteus cervinus]|uniref:Uncharacterized protein n=1 Tax=Pluteus cervinus TaxID=181527 RepID=A0ACD3AFN4_9AGAR|nr:hypothetical protein BDN72DRAFT_963237 [Pluteus cervinus]